MTCDAVVVSYRSGSLVADVIRALRAFTPVNEIIVVNNSPDDGRALDEAAAAGAVVIENSWNHGFAAAVNQAIERSQADYVILVNPDITEVAGPFAAIERIFERDPLAAAVGIRLENPDGSLQDSCRRAPRVLDFVGESLALSQRLPRWRRTLRFRMLEWQYDTECVVDAASGAFLVVRRAALDAVGPFDERFFVYGEELDWLIRAKKAGWRTYFTPAVSARHAAGGSSDRPRTTLSLLLAASSHVYAAKHLGQFRAALLRLTLSMLEIVRIAAAVARTDRASKIGEGAARLRVHRVAGYPRDLVEQSDGR